MNKRRLRWLNSIEIITVLHAVYAYEVICLLKRFCAHIEIDFLFQIPQDTMMKCKFSYIEQGEPVSLEELGDGNANEDYHSYLETCIASILKVI